MRGEKKPGQPIAGQRVRCLVLHAAQRDGVDLLGGDEQERVVAAQAQLFRHGQSRKEMAAGSSASNGNFMVGSSYILTLYGFRHQRRGTMVLVHALPVHIKRIPTAARQVSRFDPP